jgi:AcrR family transcriptional regulator
MNKTDTVSSGQGESLSQVPGQPAHRLRADAQRSRARLLAAATEAFAEKGADAPLEDIARRAGVGIGTLYRHFPTRLDLQAAVFTNQVDAVCSQADELAAGTLPAQAFNGWIRALAGYLVTKRGLSHALIDSLGKDSELMTSCWTRMHDTADQLLKHAQRAGVVRPDVTSQELLRLVHGIVITTEQSPDQADRLLSLMLDGVRARLERPGPHRRRHSRRHRGEWLTGPGGGSRRAC